MGTVFGKKRSPKPFVINEKNVLNIYLNVCESIEYNEYLCLFDFND